MPTRETETIDHPGVGTAAKEVADHAKTLVGLELELASLELKRNVGALGVGIAIAVAAAVLALYAFGFLLAAAAAGIATATSTWFALLLVGVVLFVIAGIAGAFALSAFKKGAPPVPEQAIEEARRTTESLRSNGGR